MKYRVRIKPSAEKDVRRLPDAILRRVHAAILRLAEDPTLAAAASWKVPRAGIGCASGTTGFFTLLTTKLLP